MSHFSHWGCMYPFMFLCDCRCVPVSNDDPDSYYPLQPLFTKIQTSQLQWLETAGQQLGLHVTGDAITDRIQPCSNLPCWAPIISAQSHSHITIKHSNQQPLHTTKRGIPPISSYPSVISAISVIQWKLQVTTSSTLYCKTSSLWQV